MTQTEQAPSKERMDAFEKWEESQGTKKSKTVSKRVATAALKARHKPEYDAIVKHVGDQPEIDTYEKLPAAVK